MKPIRLIIEFRATSIAILAGKIIDCQFHIIYHEEFFSSFINNYQVLNSALSEEIALLIKQMEEKSRLKESSLILVLPPFSLSAYQAKAQISLPGRAITAVDIKQLKERSVIGFNNPELEVIEILPSSFQLSSFSGATFAYPYPPIGETANQIAFTGHFLTFNRSLAHSYVDILSKSKHLPELIITNQSASAIYYRHYQALSNYLLLDIGHTRATITLVLNHLVVASNTVEIGLSIIDDKIAEEFSIDCYQAGQLRLLHAVPKSSEELLYYEENNHGTVAVSSSRLAKAAKSGLDIISERIEKELDLLDANCQLKVFLQGEIAELENIEEIFLSSNKRVFSTLRPGMIGARKFNLIAMLGGGLASI